MEIRLINLDRSGGRLAGFMQANDHLSSVRRFSALEGTAFEPEVLVRHGYLTAETADAYTQGAIGAAMSHVSLWEEAIESGAAITAAEDDAIFHRDFYRHAENVMKTAPDWDLLLWGWNFDLFMSFEMLPGISTCLAQFDQARMREHVGEFQRLSIEPKPFPLVWSFGIPCYTVTPRGAERLKRHCLPLRQETAPFPDGGRTASRFTSFRNVGIDSAMNGAWRGMNAYVCFPPLVVTKNEQALSTVQTDLGS